MNKSKILISVVSGSILSISAFAGSDAQKTTKTSTTTKMQTSSTQSANSSSYSKNTIREAQTALNTNGFSVDVDGVIGADTRNAIRSFQVENKLETTGALNHETLSALNVRDYAEEGRSPASVESENSDALEMAPDMGDTSSSQNKTEEAPQPSME